MSGVGVVELDFNASAQDPQPNNGGGSFVCGCNLRCNLVLFGVVDLEQSGVIAR